MLTHENVVADVSSVVLQLGDLKPAKNDVMISFLPLAHMLERCCEVTCVPQSDKELIGSVKKNPLNFEAFQIGGPSFGRGFHWILQRRY